MEILHFSCTLCGECCSGDMKVFLNSHDLYKMGRFLKLTHTGELFSRRLVILDRGQNGLLLPRILFKTKPFSFCPFLVNDFQEETGLRGLCSLHPDSKPLVCRMAPLCREIDLEKKTDTFTFILPHPACPGPEGGNILEPSAEREAMKEELELEMRYYRLLSGPDRDLTPLWNFPLDRPYREILKEWES